MIAPNLKIKTKLPLFVAILSVLPILLLSFIIMEVNTTSAMKNYQMIISNQAESSAKYISDFYNTQKNALIYSSNLSVYKKYLHSLNGTDSALNSSLFNDIIKLQQTAISTDNRINNIFLTDADGKIVACPDKTKLGISLEHTKAYKDAKEKRMDTFQIIDENDKKEILIAYPVIDDDGSVIGSIFRLISIDEIDKHVNSSKIGSNGYIYILDQNYNVLSCNSNINITPFLESEQSKKIFKNIKKDALSYKSYFFEYNLEDTKTLASYHLIAGCSWIVVVAIPHSEINHSSFFINNIIILAATITGIVSLVLSLLFVKGITNPLESLIDNIDAVANGNLYCNYTYEGNDEFAQVYKAIKVMSNKLDISYKKLEESAKTDILTGLPNRTAIYDIMDKNINCTNQAAMLLDLDGFKNVNDSYGHDFGDAVLVSVANILKSFQDKHIYQARLGGDEFLIFISHFDKPDMVECLGQKIFEEISNIKTAIGKPISISVSIGIAFSDENDFDKQNLIKKADLAMYKVKRNGKSGVLVFNDTLKNE